jgi:pimeloyl-ACP methyl ester carboxylesterase
MGISARSARCRVGGLVLDATLKLPDGRTLAYADLGAPDGPLVMSFHGAPSSRLETSAWDDDFKRLGVRLVAPERPGYGLSSPLPGRQREQWPADVAVLADSLGRERFAVMGASSGGPYTVACAALMGDRVVAATVVAGVTDVAWAGYFEQYGDSFPAIKEVMSCPDEASAQRCCIEHYGVDGRGFGDSVPELGAADRAFFRDSRQLASRFMHSMGEAFRQGTAAFAQDLLIEGQPWAFDPTTITIPVRVVHGELDMLCPVGHSRHTAEVIPTASFELVPRHGHISILAEYPRFAADMAQVLG